MKLYSLHANFEWKLAQKWVMTWFSKTRKGPYCHITLRKYQKCCKQMNFYLSKFKFENGLKPKTYIFGTFLRQTAPRKRNPKKGGNIFADSEPCIKYGYFGTRVSRWSKWNGGVIIFSHTFLTNVLIAGKPLYAHNN